MELEARREDQSLSDAELIRRLATLDLCVLDDGGVWCQRSFGARQARLAANFCLQASPVLYVHAVSRALQMRVADVVDAAPELGACRSFLTRGRALDA